MDTSLPFDFAAAARRDRSLAWSAALIGFALGGFLDGILLHQILQWHHLLSGLDGARFRDLRVQILADGLFHGLMYVIAGVGLWRFWRAHTATVAPGARERVCGAALAGFGSWHVLDGLLSHWLLGLHRIRMDVPDPLFWDVLWLVLFGLLPLAAGVMLLRAAQPGSRPPYPGYRAARGGRHIARLLVCATVAAGLLAARMPALPPGPGPASSGPASTVSRSDAVLLVLRPGISPARWLDEVAALGGQVRWVDASGTVWAVELPAQRGTVDLLARGALLTSRTGVIAGCLAWTGTVQASPEVGERVAPGHRIGAGNSNGALEIRLISRKRFPAMPAHAI